MAVSIVMICTGNVCRSPFAEKLLQHHLNKIEACADWVVSSAGTNIDAQVKASYGSVVMAAERGLDLDAHVAQAVSAEIIQNADLLLCMTHKHKQALQQAYGTHADKVYLLSEMVGVECDVADPFEEPLEAYRVMAEEVEQLIEQGLPKIIDLASLNATSRQ